jgi:hypothetical protein
MAGSWDVADEEKLGELIIYAAGQLLDDPTGGAVKINKILFFSERNALTCGPTACRSLEPRIRSCRRGLRPGSWFRCGNVSLLVGPRDLRSRSTSGCPNIV